MRKKLLIMAGVAAFAATVVVSLPYLMLFLPPWKGKLVESWESSDTPFKVRINMHAEANGGFVPGAYYVFQAAPSDASQWREVMTFRHDDPVAIPRGQARFMNGRVGYVFMGWMYAVTTDGGATWSVWDAGKNLSGWECCNYGLIKDVRLESDGRGIMILDPIAERRGEVPELRTKDFGRRWSL